MNQAYSDDGTSSLHFSKSPPYTISRSSIGGRTDVVAEPGKLAAHVADWFAELVNNARGPVRVALCGGNTPRALYTLLGSPEYRTRVEWDRVHLFWGDERFVSVDNAQSNYRMVRETLLRNAPIPSNQIFPMPVIGYPDGAAKTYQLILHRAYGADILDPSRPLFDLNFLGLGTDGHTASLLPDQPVLQEKTEWVASVPQGREHSRLTLTYPAL
ncbi:MAG: 6-phosphogluconolactonase, partial [Herminiimonas sp.]|nr:6-phosphogluconolactonase [Herminiimonas sp.]